uniref:UPF0337 protein BC_3635 n=1 Tax=Anthurium amnicola TaxID=1678845 RepID=A0A1D1ZLN2_9ARAE
MSSHDNNKSTNEPSKIAGNKEYYTGAAKEKIGQALGNEELQAEGTHAKNKGMAEVEAAKTKAYAEGTTEKAKGNVKNTIGSALGNEQWQAEGMADKTTGAAKQETNK